jgi:tetratricopeptide (TPR) repeat protein
MKFLILFLFSIAITSSNSFGQELSGTDTLSPEKAIQNYKSILKRNKHSSYALYGLASSYFIKKDYNASLKYSKNNTNEPNDYRAESYVLYACSLDRMGRISEALKVYEKALKYYPENFQLWYQYSLSCYKYRYFDKSLSAINKVIELQPLFVPAHYLNGCLLFENSNDPRCISAFLFALLIDNDSLRSQQATAFLNEYLRHNMSNVNIPFQETRLAIITVDNILYYYISKKVKDKIFGSSPFESLCGLIDDYLKSAKDLTIAYKSFYSTMDSSKFDVVFSHYVLRISDNDYIKKWYKINSHELAKFADFLNKNLPGK